MKNFNIKIAQIPMPSDRQRAKPETPPVTKPTTSPIKKTKPAGSGLSKVKELQNSIINFAQVAANTDLTSMTGADSQKQYGEQSRSLPGDEKSKNDKEFLGGTNPFANFFTENYLQPQSSQYTNVDVSGKEQRQSASMSGENLRGIIDSLQRIGTPGVNKGEKSSDGVWAHRTQQAIENIYTLTAGMLKFLKDMNFDVKGYSEQSLKTFKEAIPSTYTELKSNADKERYAEYLTKHIKAITEFFKNVQTNVLNNDVVKKYINQSESFKKYDTVKKPSKEVLPASYYTTPLPVKMPGLKRDVFVSDLSDINKFKKLLKDAGFEQDQETIKRFLKALKFQLTGN